MTWNYRVCRQVYKPGTADEEVMLTFREVYYNSDGKIVSYSNNPAAPIGETVEEMRFVLNKMAESLNKEIVDIDNLFQ